MNALNVIAAGMLALMPASVACARSGQDGPVAGKDGNKYVPYEERTGNESIVYFTRDLSPEGLKRRMSRCAATSWVALA